MLRGGRGFNDCETLKNGLLSPPFGGELAIDTGEAGAIDGVVSPAFLVPFKIVSFPENLYFCVNIMLGGIRASQI